MHLALNSSRRRAPRASRLRRYIPTNQPTLRFLLSLSRKRRAEGDLDGARKTARMATLLHPRSGSARLHLARMLSAAPTSPVRLDKALQILRPDLEDTPTSRPLIGLLIENLSTRLEWSGMTETAELDLLATLPDAPVIWQLESHLNRELSRGNTDGALDLSGAFFAAVPTIGAGLVAHQVAIAAGRIDRARTVLTEIQDRSLASPEDSAYLSSTQDLASGRPDAAIAALVELRPQREPRYSKQLVRSLRSAGKHREIIDYIEQTAHGLSPLEAGIMIYDAHDSVGDHDAAHDILSALIDEHFDDLNLFRRLRASALRRDRSDELRDLADRLNHLEEAWLRAEAPSLIDIAKLMSLRFEMEQFDRVEQLANRVRWESVHPASSRLLARAAYLRRDFPSALRHISALEPTGLPWDIQKLKARVLFEQGDVQASLESRHREHMPIDGFDEVTYHALLALGYYENAFESFVAPADARRFADIFEERYETRVRHTPTRDRLIVAQSGPGDEVLLASSYELVLQRSTRLAATCDPRLASLLRRSFPMINFVPVDRQKTNTRPAGVDATQDLLNDEGFAIGMESDSVVLARSLGLLKHAIYGTNPIQPYLIPDPVRVEHFRSEWQKRPVVGITWRSERREAQRNIHYVGVEDLAPLLERSAQFLCLQYDATAEEIEKFRELAGPKASFVSDVDLRNDLDTTAALLRSLTATVGIGTTTTELSAAVGTATIMIQPTRFGTWRAVGPNGADYWHRTMRVTDLDTPWDRPRIVAQACLRLDEILSTSYPSVDR